VHDERVKLVEELLIGRKSRLKHSADFVVAEFRMGVTVAFQDATSVGVDYEDGIFAGVEKDGVGGFRADSTKGEKLSAKNVRASGEKAREGTCI
jgi:hypothetical protein